MCEVSNIIEATYKRLHVPQSALPFPTGMRGFAHPDTASPSPAHFLTFSRVVLISPVEHPTFRENILALADTLSMASKLSGVPIPVTIASEPDPDPSALHLTFTAGEPRLQPKHFIAYELEQMPFVPPSQRFLNRLKGALDVWDYSLLNIEYMRVRGIEARHVPFAASPVYVDKAALPASDKRDCVMLLGHFVDPSGRTLPWRQQVLESLAQQLLPARMDFKVCQDKCWGTERFECRIGLNIPARPDGASILEVHRIVPWIANDVYVVSLPSNDSWYDARFEDLADIVSLERLADHLRALSYRNVSYFVDEVTRRQEALFARMNQLDIFVQSGALQSLLRRLGHNDTVIGNALASVWGRPDATSAPGLPVHGSSSFPADLELRAANFSTTLQFTADSIVDDISRFIYIQSTSCEPDEVVPWKVSNLSEQVEEILDQSGYPEFVRRWPGGTVGMPDRAESLRRRFKRIKLHFDADVLIWDEQLTAIAVALEEHARRLGGSIPVVKTRDTEYPDHDSLYILFTYGYPIVMPRYYIAVQMEQVAAWTPKPRYFRKLRGALEVWDYSAFNIEALAKLGFRGVRHVPLTLSPTMTVPLRGRRSTHVIFFGGYAGRRLEILPKLYDQVTGAGFSFRMGERIHGADRYDALVAVNIHSLNVSIQEVHRILPLVANRVWVVTEPSDDAWYDERLGKVVDIVPTEQLGARILEVLALDEGAFEAEVERRREVLLRDWEPWRLMQESGALDFLAERVGPQAVQQLR